MSEAHAERNNRLKATMREQNSPNLNRSGKGGVVVSSPKQSKNPPRTPNGHVIRTANKVRQLD